MGLDKNLELLNQESLKLTEFFKQFGDLHEEIKEFLPREEQETDSKAYEYLHIEICCLREAVQKWMVEAGQRISEEKREKRSSKSSIRSSVKSRSSKISRPSTTSSRVIKRKGALS